MPKVYKFLWRKISSSTCSDRRLRRLMDTMFPVVEYRRSQLTLVAGIAKSDWASLARQGNRLLFCFHHVSGQPLRPIAISFKYAFTSLSSALVLDVLASAILLIVVAVSVIVLSRDSHKPVDGAASVDSVAECWGCTSSGPSLASTAGTSLTRSRSLDKLAASFSGYWL